MLDLLQQRKDEFIESADKETENSEDILCSIQECEKHLKKRLMSLT